jgi:hypothetical protein
VDELRLRAENKGQLKALDSFAAWFGLAEPHMVPESVLNAYFGYLIKEGVVDSHMKALSPKTSDLPLSFFLSLESKALIYSG